MPKRLKLQPQISLKSSSLGVVTTTSQPAKAVDVFEQAQAPVGKKIEFRLTDGIAGVIDGSLPSTVEGEPVDVLLRNCSVLI